MGYHEESRTGKYIGIFDSGFGGLSVMKGIIRELPEYNYVFLGDTARMPYGTRSKEIIYAFVQDAVNFLFEKGCELIILACNTASCEALHTIQHEYLEKHYAGKKVLGVLIPAVETACELSKNGKIGVMATQRTVISKKFINEITKRAPRVRIYQQACPLLAPLVEAGEQNSDIATIVLQKYLNPLLVKGIDTLILGCTHYGLFETKIKRIVGKHINVVSESRIIGKKLKYYLCNHQEIENMLEKNKKRVFYSTDLTESFKKLGSVFFGEEIEVKKIELK